MPTGIVIPQLDPTTVTVPAAGTIALCADLNGVLNVIKPDASITPINPVNQTSAQVAASSVAGNQNLGPGYGVHTAVVTVSGLAGVRQFSLLKSALGPANNGFKMKVVFACPNTVQGIRLQIFDANTAGQLLFDWTTDGLQQSAVADLHFDGAQWQIDDAKVPATL